MKISCSILTNPRKEPYLQRTLESLNKAGVFSHKELLPFRLVAGSPNPEHFLPYRNDARFLVEDFPQEEADRHIFQHAGAALRATWGHRRCLHPWRANPNCDALLVMEDDIEVTSDFTQKLMTVAETVSKQFGKRWVITLYTPQSKEPLEAHKDGKKWIFRQYDNFFGAQAVLYSIRARDEYMAFLVDHVIQKPHDLALPEVLKMLEIPLLGSAPCLVQHTGAVKQGVSGLFHTSTSFLP
jgi:hypothetical protein